MLPQDMDCARLDDLLDELMDSPDRAQLLAAIEERDPRQHAALLELLHLAEHPCAEFDPERLDRRPAWRWLDATCENDRPLGERIGAWRLIRPLGRGGMGTVYEVERADGAYEQRAALKLILNDIDSSVFLQSFAHERQILARLSHPGIARLIDGGEDGHRPYLVMEYVAGERIDRYCECLRLDLRGRLQLFLQVVSAVEHAHQSRVVHRDLKPSNIAVTADGAVKLLDFGIAKVLADREHDLTVTRTAAALLTPQYATPEQIRGERVDHRSDIYQLGLLLFELLLGRRAQEPTNGTPAALLQAVCADQCPVPSVCAATIAPDRAALIGGFKPAQLARELRDDLDWIVLQALRKEPERRYPSAREFAEDVQRYLSGLPVRARPETSRYRMQKFVRRNPWPVTSAIVAFVVTIAYGSTATLQARMIAVERDRAALQAQTAEQVKTLVLSILRGASPEQALGRELTARELLDSSWPSIEAQTRDRPQVQIEILETMAETYRQLGAYDRARQHLQRSQQLIDAHPSLPRELVAQASRTLGRLLTDIGEYEAAERSLQQAQTLFEKRYGSIHIELATSLKDLGQLAHRRGRDGDAEQFYLRALAIYRVAAGNNRRAMADCLERLAVTYTQQSNYAQAARMLEQTLALQEQLLPEGHPDIAGNRASLAEALHRLGRYEAAEAMYREALSSMRRSRGADHPFVATIMNNLARTLRSRENFAEARPLLIEALAIRRSQLGSRHELVAMSLSDLGTVTERLGDIEAAEGYYEEALAILPEAHAWRGSILNQIGRVLRTRGDLDAAERVLRESMDLNRTRHGADHDVVGTSLLQLGLVLRAQKREVEAERALREALRIFQLRLDSTHPSRAEATLALAQIQTAQR